MWYKNIAGRFFELVTKHACERIRGCTTMRYINLRFTYLLTYLLTYGQTELRLPRPR